MSLETRLLTFLQGLQLGLETELDEKTEIFQTGVLDSVNLLNLAEWIECEIDSPLDFTKVNILEDWATVSKIATYIQLHHAKETK